MSQSPAVPSSGSSPLHHHQRKGYEEIPLNTLRPGSTLPFRLFTQIEGEYIAYRRENSPFTEVQRDALVENDIHVVYIHQDEIDLYWLYLNDSICRIIDLPAVPAEERATIFYQSTQELSRKIYNVEVDEHTLETAQTVINSNLELIDEGKSWLHMLMKNMEEQPSLYSHSLHVCQYGLAMARQVGIHDPEHLEALGMGLLLQDVGMLEIPSSLVFKAGPLSFDEWAQVKRHPALGIEALDRAGGVADLTRQIVFSHHERLDGSGYPQGLRGDDISPEVRIAAIVDVFASLTSSRPFRAPFDTFEALKTMSSDLGTLYDPKLFQIFVGLLGSDAKSESAS